MSPSDKNTSPIYPLSILIDPGLTLEKQDIRVLVFDHQSQPVFSGHGDQQVMLPLGLYTVRIEFGSEWQDEIVRHADGTTQVYLSLPERPSPVPVFGTATTHEYYSYTSQEISKNVQSGNSGIFLFIRVHHREVYNGEWLWENLYLLDEERKQILAFGTGNGVENKVDGYYGATVPLKPGLYILQHRDKAGVPREMPLYVFDSWQTQVFVFYNKRALLESSTVLLSHYGAGFNPDDRFADVIDMALRGLQSEQETLPNQALNMLLYGKFKNPMLGLLGAHFLLRRSEIDTNLLNDVLYNLNYLLPTSPDVCALALMARAKTGLQIDFGPPYAPPMLRAGLDAVYDLSAQSLDYADLIPSGSLLERIASNRYIDSAYSSWKPLRKTRSAPAGTKGAATIQVDPWILAYLEKQKASAEAAHQEIDLTSFARRLNLPLKTIDAAWKLITD